MNRNLLVGLASVSILLLAWAAFTSAAVLPAPSLEPYCNSDDLRTQHADVVATGTVSGVQTEHYSTSAADDLLRTQVTLKNVAMEKPTTQNGDNSVYLTSIIFFVPGGPAHVLGNAYTFTKADEGKRIRVQLANDANGRFALVCGEKGMKLQGEQTSNDVHLPPQPPRGMQWFALTLKPGWNLLSSSVYYDGNPACTTEPCPLTGIPPMWKIKDNSCGDLNVFHYNTQTNAYDVRSLSSMEKSYVRFSDGFWMKAKNACTITLEGNKELNSMEGQTLQKGWNQVGAGSIKENMAGLLSSCQVTAGPYRYNNPQNKWERADSLEAGQGDFVASEGYFVKVAADCTLQKIPAETYCTADSDCVRQGSLCDCGMGKYVNRNYYVAPPAGGNQCMCAIQLSKGVCQNNQCIGVADNTPA